MKAVVSVIHGARRIGNLAGGPPDWPKALKDFLEKKGFTEVRPFYWSGKVQDAFSAEVAARYGEVLRGLAEDHPNHDMYILGKSMGAIIAEFALCRLGKQRDASLGVRRFLRIGCPDRRPPIRLPLVGSVANITSSADVMARIWSPPITLILRTFPWTPCQSPEEWAEIRLQNLSHRDFNNPVAMKCPPYIGKSLYEIYAELMGSQALAIPGPRE